VYAGDTTFAVLGNPWESIIHVEKWTPRQ